MISNPDEVVEKQYINKEASGVIFIPAFADILTYPMLPGVASIFLRTSAILIAFILLPKFVQLYTEDMIAKYPFPNF